MVVGPYGENQNGGSGGSFKKEEDLNIHTTINPRNKRLLYLINRILFSMATILSFQKATARQMLYHLNTNNT